MISTTQSRPAGFDRKTYFEELFNSYILPWNCHDKLANHQNYLYTHRYKAVFGFEFSYTMRGAQFPEFEDTGVAGVGFFSSFGETSWIILDATDPKVNITGGTKGSLPQQVTANGFYFHYYNGIYYNISNSVADQTNNLALHYSQNVFSSIVNFDRGVQSYLEQTYWQHRTPGYWDNIRLSNSVPAVLSIKPCTRSDWFVEFFHKRAHWTNKLNFFSSRSYNFFRPFSGVFSNPYLRSKLVLLDRFRAVKRRNRLAWALKSLKKKYKFRGEKRKQILNAINFFYELKAPRPAAHIKLFKLIEPFLKSTIAYSNLYRRLNYSKTRRFRPAIRRTRRRKRSRIEKKIRPNSAIRSILKTRSAHHYSPRFNSISYSSIPMKGASLFLSWRYARKKRLNRRLWYKADSRYRSPFGTRTAIRYHKSYKKRKFIFVF